MVNIIPMAGVGSRFADAGYVLPKPLVPVSGKPMILQVIRALPSATQWIFIVRREHIERYHIDQLIKTAVPHAVIVPIDETTEGQAASCMLAMPFVDPREDVLIAACDNSFVYDEEKFLTLKQDPAIDAVVWTFTKDNLLSEKPEAWGWLQLENDGVTISDVSVKKPVSKNPYNDHAVVATFYFKRAQDFCAAYERMVKENYRINNEFYVDSMPIFYKKMGKRSVIFDVDLYVGWGKPSDLYQYEEREYAYQFLRSADPAAAREMLDGRWVRFFDSLERA